MIIGKLLSIDDEDFHLEISSDQRVRLKIRLAKMQEKTDTPLDFPFCPQDCQDSQGLRYTFKCRIPYSRVNDALAISLANREIRVYANFIATVDRDQKGRCDEMQMVCHITAIEYTQDYGNKIIRVPFIINE